MAPRFGDGLGLHRVRKKGLSRLQRLATLAITGAMRTVATAGMDTPLPVMTAVKAPVGFYGLICSQQWKHKFQSCYRKCRNMKQEPVLQIGANMAIPHASHG